MWCSVGLLEFLKLYFVFYLLQYAQYFITSQEAAKVPRILPFVQDFRWFLKPVSEWLGYALSYGCGLMQIEYKHLCGGIDYKHC